MFYINRCNSTDKINKSRKYEHFKNLAKKNIFPKPSGGKGAEPGSRSFVYVLR